MSSSSPTTVVDGVIELDARGIRIEGGPQLVLCASLFYFRLPREQWRARLAQVRASGYTCVDVYLPWNFHETAPGRWSFEGRRDVAAFLDLAREEGLYVIARPGPYICSEWDGGALPAWLGSDPELRVRQNEPRFLDRVTAWFDQVLPLLAERQYPTGGTVIMVQLENELDFFDCEDRAGYVTALRDQAVRHGITVPLIACSGQGDLQGATGDVPGVVPACNFYPDDDSPHIEPEVRRYAELLAERGLPLLITETNRRHRTLRRLLASGASLIAPYLQSSGWNFGYTPSAGNWGRPGNLMSHGYDFGGYVSSTGTERPEYAEAQILARVIDTLGPRLALATPTVPHTPLTTDFPTSSAPSALRLDGGGLLLAVPHLGAGGGPGTAVVNGVPVAVAADSCPLMPVDVPLGPWGHQGTLTLASADLVAAGQGVLVFSSEVPVTVVLGDTRVDIPAPAPGAPQRQTAEGLTLVALIPADAVRLRATDRDGTVHLDPPAPTRPTPPSVEVRRALGGAAPTGPRPTSRTSTNCCSPGRRTSSTCRSRAGHARRSPTSGPPGGSTYAKRPVPSTSRPWSRSGATRTSTTPVCRPSASAHCAASARCGGSGRRRTYRRSGRCTATGRATRHPCASWAAGAAPASASPSPTPASSTRPPRRPCTSRGWSSRYG